jgi:redox-sensitive bicupin YhaK (pirin superfamily)
MSWWWTAPLAVAAFGAVALSEVARRCAEEAQRAVQATDALSSTLADLRQARRRLVVDLRPCAENRAGEGPIVKGTAHH